jgi:putative toxin-antitoxin system antitoxin component (TIGR02293 family)
LHIFIAIWQEMAYVVAMENSAHSYGFAEAHSPLLAPMPPSELGQLFQQALDATRGEGGLPELTVKSLAPWTRRFSQVEIEDLIIPKRTFARRKARNEPLNSEETDRAYRLARISAEADRVFANPEKADKWLRHQNPVFQGRTPLQLMKTEVGCNMVETLLHQIDHGIFI